MSLIARLLERLSSADTVEREPPFGVLAITWSRGDEAYNSTMHRYLVVLLTFIAYASYHSARKPLSIVKSVLEGAERNASSLHGLHVALYPSLPVNHLVSQQRLFNGSSRPHWFYGRTRAYGASLEGSEGLLQGMSQGWAPFNESNGREWLGVADVTFLASYAVGMYFSGHFGDTLDLRWSLSIGMFAAGIGVALFGLACLLHVYSMYYFVTVQIISGLLQSTGWPSVVAVIGKWLHLHEQDTQKMPLQGVQKRRTKSVNKLIKDCDPEKENKECE